MRRKLLIGAAVFALGLTLTLLWPTARYDINRVDPSLRALATPYQMVATGYFMDGGSIHLTIGDRDGRKLKLALPASPEHGRSYPRQQRPGHLSVAGHPSFSDRARRRCRMG